MFLLSIRFESAHNDKMLLVRIIENNKIYAFLGQGRLSKGYLCFAGLEKGVRWGPAGKK